MTKVPQSYQVLAVIGAFEEARLAGKSDTEAFEAAMETAPSHWKRKTVANQIFNHLGKPTWNDPTYREMLGSEPERRTYFAFTDEGAKEVYIVSTRRALGWRSGQLLSSARSFARIGGYREGPCDWINRVWIADRAIYVWELEVAEAVKPHFSMKYFSVGKDGWLGPRLEFIWSYVAHRAGYSFAEKNWYDRWIPEAEVDRPGVIDLINERSWPAEPVRLVWE